MGSSAQSLQTAGLGANPLGSTAPAYLQDLAYAQFGPNPVVSTMPTQLPQTSGQSGGGSTTPLGLGGASYPQFPPGEAEALAALTSTGNGGVSPQAGVAGTPFGFGPNPYASQFPSPNYLGPPLQNGGWPTFTSPAPPGATGQSSAPIPSTAPAPGFNDQQQVNQLLPLIGLESTMQQTGMGEQNLLASMLNGQGGGFGGGYGGTPWGGGWGGGGGWNTGFGGGNANQQSANEIEQLLGPMSGIASSDPILGSLMGTGLPSIGDLFTGSSGGIGSELGLFQDLMGIGL